MPRRMIDSRIFNNERYGELPLGARQLLGSIVTHADEDGRLKGSAKFLRSISFPYDEEITASQTEQWRDLLATAGFVRTYSKNGDQFLDVPGWTNPHSEFHQVLRKDRYTPSLIPSFDEADNHLTAKLQPGDNQVSTSCPLEGKVSKGKIREDSPKGLPATSEIGKKSVDQAKGPAILPSGELDGEPDGVGEPLPAVKPAKNDDRGGDTPAKKQRVAVPKTASVIQGQTGAEPQPQLTDAQRAKQSNVGLVLQAVRDHYGFPHKTAKDPIPNYGKEGKSISRMLVRGFSVTEIVDCWKAKVAQRDNEFVSFTYVNEDIGKEGHDSKGRISGPQRASPPKRDYKAGDDAFRARHG